MNYYYVIEKVLKDTELSIEDYIKVEEINLKDLTVTLKPLLSERYVVSLKDFRNDYCII